VHLAPGDIAIAVKHDLLKAGLKNPYHRHTEVDPYRDFRRVPMYRLINRLGLNRYDVPAPLIENHPGGTGVTAEFQRVRLAFSQHLGVAALPVVQTGDRVQAGDVIGEIPPAAMGARVHASLSGVVRDVTPDFIVIEAN